MGGTGFRNSKKLIVPCLTALVSFLQVVYYANILAGVLESPELRHDESLSMMEDSFLGVKLTRNPPPPDPLGEYARRAVKRSF